MTSSSDAAVARIEQRPAEDAPDLQAYVLATPRLELTVIPQGGMIGTSLLVDGVEILGQRAGLQAWLKDGKTFGIPLLAPWANRLDVTTFEGISLDVSPESGVHPDANGLPIHGLLAGSDQWQVTAEHVEAARATLSATLSFDSTLSCFPAWPFPHELTVSMSVEDRTLTITTTVTATTETPVPVAVGWHPYFVVPELDRADWVVCSPFVEQVELDDRCVPTGQLTRVPVFMEALGDPNDDGITLDNLYAEVKPGAVAWLEGGGRRINLCYDEGYSYAVLFAPAGDSLVAIEPMSAPTDPLSGHFPIAVLQQGQSHVAAYRIAITDAGVEV